MSDPMTPAEIAALQRLCDAVLSSRGENTESAAQLLARYARHLEAQASRAEPNESTIETAQELALAVKAYGIQDGAIAIAKALDTAKRQARAEALKEAEYALPSNYIFSFYSDFQAAAELAVKTMKAAIRALAAAPNSPAPDEKE